MWHLELASPEFFNRVLKGKLGYTRRTWHIVPPINEECDELLDLAEALHLLKVFKFRNKVLQLELHKVQWEIYCLVNVHTELTLVDVMQTTIRIPTVETSIKRFVRSAHS
jgi:hypothetical protein